RIDQVIEADDELPAVTHELKIDGPPTLSLRNLYFAYPNTEEVALSGINLELRGGQTLGIFGRTGSGKTTLVNLLARVYTPPAGTIFLDEQDITKVQLQDLRAQLAVVPQDPFLFSTTLRDNIRLMGERTGHARTQDAEDATLPTQQEVVEPVQNHDPMLDRVLADACLEDDIANLSEGLDTVVGERGVMLSGGQRQRAALARALYQAPPLLLLDDVLSAVDQGTETRLVAAIRGLREQDAGSTPTTVIVSHRTSVLEHADEILVLDQGQVVERGTHAELVALGGHYAEAHVHQRTEDSDV
ncbi:MAG: ABC transporter ATP-binding protein, partial [Nannocystaceae bacterium]